MHAARDRRIPGYAPTQYFIWVGIDESEPLRLLNRDVEQSIAALGLEVKEAVFSPHFTIGRVRGLGQPRCSNKGMDNIKRYDFWYYNGRGNPVHERHAPKQAGPVYSKIAGFKLGET